MSKSPAFQFYPADFLSDENVVLMSNTEIGCYIKLMCYCWREGSIPSDVNKIAKLCGEDGSAMAHLWLAISPCFAVANDSPDRLVHPRLLAEREKQLEHKKERSESGKKGAKSRWGNVFEESATVSKADSSAIAKPLAKPIAKNSFSSSSSSSSSNNNFINESDDSSKTVKSKKATYSKDLFIEYQIDGQLLDDFITLRKEKKLPITATAINGLKREGEKVGLTLPEVIKICCERGWGGFNSNWKIDLPKLVTGGGFQDAI